MAFNGSRLSIARQRQSLSQKGFAERVGVTPHTISRCESGSTVPSDETLRAMARVLNYPIEFFFGPDLELPLAASFRSQARMTAASRNAALAAGVLGGLVADWVQDRFHLPDMQVPELTPYRPEQAARALREEWGLGERPISNMIQLLEAKGVRVFSLTEDTLALNAFSVWRDGTPFVFLNTVKSGECSRFDAAHELAHLVLHQDGRFSQRAAETEADQFASAFLMPAADVRAQLPRVGHLGHLLQAKGRWRVSLAALTYRLHALGLLSDWRYRDFCVEISKQGWRTKEPNPIDRETSAVWEKVLQLLWQDRITPARMAKELAVPEAELNQLVFGLLQSPRPSRAVVRDDFSVVGAPGARLQA